ncbi:cupin domain-containing protein [Aeoliella sp.]|uniref:cupin domain-containing protein n=1 Tax=Aeoliella sp. TaxID=2795800 RepID=UPI003CCBDC70
MKNLFSKLPTSLNEELTTVLAESPTIRIERIVSTGQSSPEDYWYDQTENEWVAVLQGQATLRFEDGEVLQMTPGDFVLIPAHRKHRVDWTSPEEPTVWLAVFYSG